jgi:hypothetical protein
VVTGLYTDEQTKYTFGGPVKTVALDPDYAVKKSRQVCELSVGGNIKRECVKATTSTACTCSSGAK